MEKVDDTIDEILVVCKISTLYVVETAVDDDRRPLVKYRLTNDVT